MVRAASFLGLAAVLAVSAPVLAAPAPLTEKPYSADAEIAIGRAGQSEAEMLRGAMHSKVKFYVDGDNTRVEVLDPNGVPPHCEIYHSAAKEKFLFNAGDPDAHKFPVTARNSDPIELLAHFAAGGATPDGTDAVGGDLCTRYKGTLSNGQAVLVWVGAKGLPVKIADGATFVLVFSKFHYGPQSPALFMPPGGKA